MNGDPASLDNLRDLALPPAVPFWPPAPGLWIVAAGLFAAIAIAAWRAIERHRANAYRRAALAELDAIANAGGSIEQVSAVMKRAALVAYPRERVAPLTGAAWTRFLAETGGCNFDAAAIGPTLAAAYEGRPRSGSDLETLLAQARIWVHGHGVADASGGG